MTWLAPMTAIYAAAAAVPLKRWGTLGAGYLLQSSGGVFLTERS